jgi:hypothetical protein
MAWTSPSRLPDGYEGHSERVDDAKANAARSAQIRNHQFHGGRYPAVTGVEVLQELGAVCGNEKRHCSFYGELRFPRIKASRKEAARPDAQHKVWNAPKS